MDRRSFIKSSALVGSTLLVPGIPAAAVEARAEASGKGFRQAGFYRLRVGDVEVIAVSDGTLRSAPKLLHAKPGEVERLLRASWVSMPRHVSVNAFLIRLDGRNILIDAGTGDQLGPTLNKLTANLEALGVPAGAISDILLTHIHADHSGGLAVGGTMLFPNAIVHGNRVEATFWTDRVNQAKARQEFKRYFEGPKRTYALYAAAGKVKPFDGQVELFPGLSAHPAPGHTPGHTFYVLESKGEKLMFWGDTVHVAEGSFPRQHSHRIRHRPPRGGPAAQTSVRTGRAPGIPCGGGAPLVSRVWAGGQKRSGYTWIPIPYVNDESA